MRKLWIVCKNELLRYFLSPLAYVYLMAFLLLNSSFAIYFGHFFDRGRANLLAMFAYQPWLYLLFIPGISMRLWAEEFRNKTVVQIMTMPVSTSALVLGKFLASWLFCGLALMLTFPFWITVNVLGEPDNMVIFISYLGSFLIAGCMLSISQTMSALSKNQVSALVLSVFAILIFMLSGLEYVLSFFRLFAPLPIIDMIASFSFENHFFSIIRGLLELRDILFFASIMLLFNFTTIIIVNFRTSGAAGLFKSTNKTYYILCFILLLCGFVGLNLLFNNYARSIKYDFTQEKIFTLTQSTQKILQNLPDEINIKLYYTPELGRRNPEYRNMFDQIRLLLKQYADLSNNKLSYAIYMPAPFSKAEDIAITHGLQAIPLIDSNEPAYFGLTINNSLDKYSVIKLFTLERQNFLEQDITEAIYQLFNTKPEIGIISTLPVFDTVIANVATSHWAIIDQLEKYYTVKSISSAKEISSKLKALIIIHPRDFSSDMIEAIKQYANRGGKILLFMDISTDSERLFAPVQEDFKPSDLNQLTNYWGFNFNSDMAIADLDNSLTVQVSNDSQNPRYTQDLLQFYILADGINQQAPETKNLKKLLLSSVSSISPLPGANIIFVPLLKSSSNSQAVSSAWAQKVIDPSILLKKFKKDDYIKVIAAHIISKDAKHPFDIIAVADTDILYDSFWAKSISTNEENLIIPIFDNANFVLNALEVLLGQNDLIELRGKSAKERHFQEVEHIRKKSQQDFAVQEQEILSAIEKSKAGLKEIFNKKNFEERSNFSAAELSIITNVRKELNQQYLKLRNIRQNLNQKIDQIDTKVKFYNIYAIPLLLIIILVILKAKQMSRKGKASNEKFVPNRQLLYLGLISLFLLGLGILSVHLNTHQKIDDFENKPLFSDLANKINEVDEIVLKSNLHTLTFKKKDGEWSLQEYPNLFVIQERVRSFLSALLEARYYERKSDKAENLSYYGLQPTSLEGSPNIRVELKNKIGKNILSFEVGKYDIEIGRGTRAAYIKFDNQFQVWLAAIELVDLSTDGLEWTYSNLWDLSFGRLLSCNHNTNIDDLADLAKYLLNTPILSTVANLENPEQLFELNLQVEGNEKIDLSFLKNGDKYYVKYHFATIPKETKLNRFASYMQGKYQQISESNMEKIKDVYEQKISDTRTEE